MLALIEHFVNRKKENKMLPMIGIIAGKGLLPISIANYYISLGGQCCIVALDHELDPIQLQNFEHKFLQIGMIGNIIGYFKKHNVKKLLFAGSVNRPNLRSLKVDLKGSLLLAKILKQKFLGDDKLLKIITEFLEDYGFEVIGSDDILNNKANLETNSIISDSDQNDINYGVAVLNALGGLDVGQSVVVEDGLVLGIEAAEGTDNLIKRCANLRKKDEGAVLIKMVKSFQDKRFDIPTIGVDTMLNLINCRYNGVAVQKNSVILLESENILTLAQQHNIFIKQI